MSELMNSVDAYIEFAEATNKFSDLAFYQRVKAALSRADHAEELAAMLTKILHGAPLEYLHPDNVKAASLALNNYREATE